MSFSTFIFRENSEDLKSGKAIYMRLFQHRHRNEVSFVYKNE